MRRLSQYVDQKATYWHMEFMTARTSLVLNPDRLQYCKGMADAYSEVFHYLTLMRGYPW